MKDWGTADSDMLDRFPEVRERRLQLEDVQRELHSLEVLGDGQVVAVKHG